MDYLNTLFIDKQKQEYVKRYFNNINKDDNVKKIYNMIIKYVNVNNLENFILITRPILNSYEFQRRIDFPHHGNESIVEHSIKVASLAYKIAPYFHVNLVNVILASLMHDMYSTPWQNQKRPHNIFQAHGFVHPRIALTNCKKYYPELMNNVIENSILCHMFPLTPRKPKYAEGWLIVFCDKYVSMNIFKDVKKLPTYIGIKNIRIFLRKQM